MGEPGFFLIFIMSIYCPYVIRLMIMEYWTKFWNLIIIIIFMIFRNSIIFMEDESFFIWILSSYEKGLEKFSPKCVISAK